MLKPQVSTWGYTLLKTQVAERRQVYPPSRQTLTTSQCSKPEAFRYAPDILRFASQFRIENVQLHQSLQSTPHIVVQRNSDGNFPKQASMMANVLNNRFLASIAQPAILNGIPSKNETLTASFASPFRSRH